MTYPGWMATQRPRNASETRADILAAARVRFGADGYERTTLRAVAADVGVDPALVIRYFGSKQELFAAAAEFTLDLPDLTGLDADRIADALLPKFFAVWEDDTTFVALLRAAMTSPTAMDTMRMVFATQVAPVLAKITPDHAAQRVGLMGAFVMGSTPDWGLGKAMISRMFSSPARTATRRSTPNANPPCGGAP